MFAAPRPAQRTVSGIDDSILGRFVYYDVLLRGVSLGRRRGLVVHQVACRRRRASCDGNECPRVRATVEAALVSGPNPFTVVRPSIVTLPDRGEMTITADGNCRSRTASGSPFTTSPRPVALFRPVLMLLLA